MNMAVDRNEHLQSVLDTHKMVHIDKLVTKHKNKRDEINEALKNNYIGNIYTPINSGSFGKHTAINIKFDLDIIVPFKRNAFTTLQNMYDDVFVFLEDKYKDVATVRKQKVSIGVLFNEDADGDCVNIDVVPGRELSQDDYKESYNLNLCFNEDHWGFAKGSYTKTNIQAQIDHIKSKENERKVIRLLKIWKHTNSEKYKSFLFELITIKAFDKADISGSLWDKLKGVLEYIRDNVAKEEFTLKDPGNTNNDVIQTLESYERTWLSNKMSNIINRIEENSENIKTYFPINEDYNEDDAADNSYGIKGAVVSPSIPTNSLRFG